MKSASQMCSIKMHTPVARLKFNSIHIRWDSASIFMQFSSNKAREINQE